MVILESKWLESVLNLLIGFTVIILINIFSSQHFFRLDLTQEKRFSISEPTKLLLENLDDDVYVEVYLEGDLPSGFRRLRNSIEETLEEFRIYSGNRVHYTFINPDIAGSARSRNEFMMDIAQRGIQPTDVFLNENGRRIQKRILPGALISYGSREKGVLLFKGNKRAPAEVRLNQSAEGVEYELAKTIKTLTKEAPETIGFTQGHSELTGRDIVGFLTTLQENYIVRDVFLDKDKLESVDLLIIAKPQKAFRIKERLALDQYIMGGGKVIFLIDALMASVDSTSISLPYKLELDDMLYRYGLRINKDLIMDMLAASAPVVVGNMGDQPQIQLLPWPFYPLINTYGRHPIVRNLDAIKMAFVSSIDTVSSKGVIKTPILLSSINSKAIAAPIIIDLDELKKQLDPSVFNEKNIPVGYLLEGMFTSAFKNRPLPKGVSIILKNKSVPTKIIVIGDGDIIRNEYNPQNGRPVPLGFDVYDGITYANEDFMMNAISYLLDDSGLILSRNKEIVLRPLKKQKIATERMKWQLINMVLPIAFILMFGLLWHFIRIRRYTSN